MSILGDLVWEDEYADVHRGRPGPGYVDFFVDRKMYRRHIDDRRHVRGWADPGWRFWRSSIREAHDIAIDWAKRISKSEQERARKVRETLAALGNQI